MNNIYFVLRRKLILLVIIILPFSCTKESEKLKEQSEILEKDSLESIALVRSMISELMKLPSTPPGLSVAVGSKNDIIYAEGFGFTDQSIGKKVTSETQFRAGSLSRVFTTTALSKLIDNSLINLNSDVHAFIPDYPKKAYPISIKQLALGISGMPHYTEEDKLENKDYTSVEEALGVFSHIPLTEKPGDKYQFSIHSYTLLSRVLEKAYNKNFIKILDDEVIVPLNLSSTAAESLLKSKNELTKYYQFTADDIHEEITNPRNYSFSWAGSGLVSTPSDLVLLSQSLTNGFISKATIDTIFEKQLLNSGDTLRESIGWDSNWDMADRRVFEQDGAGEGTRSIISLFPDYNLSISMMTNSLRLWAIEETAHTLAIPFLIKAEPTIQPKGSIDIKVFEDNGGNWVEKTGELILSKDENQLIINPGAENEESYMLIYLNRKNMYALIHPDGILYTEINEVDSKITGKVMYYRGPNIRKTSAEPPYLKFSS
ncbi:serine hydrolase domain-containing protein [Fulvivirga lutea]|uniref:Beta-lactamase family protein n=1 Tax=Fulvivirga lutea TaxID=2810512 RepID=A0A975A208_9BACT|nr:serine hydrolase domain-containing protein [Fulvivirga lutea]QSE98037.1 beta-lactamase family protein [Fulvivirga lutea]